jgi:hypothetical protein
MPQQTSSADLDEVHELNRLFIEYLKARARSGDDCLGLRRGIVALLSDIAPGQLETISAFPRALFRLNLDRIGAPIAFDSCSDVREQLRRVSLELTILHSAWNLSRRSAYGARLFMGLEARQILLLRTTPLSDLPKISTSSNLVSCGFLDSPWLWQELLTEIRPESRRQLLLIGMQPQLQS